MKTSVARRRWRERRQQQGVGSRDADGEREMGQARPFDADFFCFDVYDYVRKSYSVVSSPLNAT